MNNFEAFAKDMIELCRKHGAVIDADDEGEVFLYFETSKNKVYDSFTFTPRDCEMVSIWDDSLPIIKLRLKQ